LEKIFWVLPIGSEKPFGTEVYFEYFVEISGKTGHFYVHYGHPDFHKSWCAGLSIANLVSGPKFSLLVKINIWNQPSLLLGGETVRQNRRGLGGAVFGNFFYKLTHTPLKMGVTAYVGYKTAGYLEGENLGRRVIFRAGFGFLE
jgi:hypothetical protein